MTTFALSVPRFDRATSAPRLSAIVKAVRLSVWPTQSHTFSLASAQDVSSISKGSGSRSGGTGGGGGRSWPGCPPRLGAEAGAGGGRLTFTAGRSDEGDFEELLEFWLRSASRSAMRFSKEAMTAMMAAW